MKMTYDDLLKTIITGGIVYTAVMVKKTHDLLNEYTHRDGWETSHEYWERVQRIKKEKRQKEQEEYLNKRMGS